MVTMVEVRREESLSHWPTSPRDPLPRGLRYQSQVMITLSKWLKDEPSARCQGNLLVPEAYNKC